MIVKFSKCKRHENFSNSVTWDNKSMEKGLESHPVQKLYIKNATELNNYRKMSKLRAYWDSLSLFGKIVMAIALLIFVIVAGAEHLIARMTGTTYNEVNIIVYYLVIPLSWTLMLDYITRMPFLTPMFLSAWIIFIWKDKMKFRNRCDWAFKKSVVFLLWFKKIGWNYVVSSVIICVVIPILVYIELIYAIINLN